MTPFPALWSHRRPGRLECTEAQGALANYLIFLNIPQKLLMAAECPRRLTWLIFNNTRPSDSNIFVRSSHLLPLVFFKKLKRHPPTTHTNLFSNVNQKNYTFSIPNTWLPYEHNEFKCSFISCSFHGFLPASHLRASFQLASEGA